MEAVELYVHLQSLIGEDNSMQLNSTDSGLLSCLQVAIQKIYKEKWGRPAQTVLQQAKLAEEEECQKYNCISFTGMAKSPFCKGIMDKVTVNIPYANRSGRWIYGLDMHCVYNGGTPCGWLDRPLQWPVQMVSGGIRDYGEGIFTNMFPKSYEIFATKELTANGWGRVNCFVNVTLNLAETRLFACYQELLADKEVMSFTMDLNGSIGKYTCVSDRFPSYWRIPVVYGSQEVGIDGVQLLLYSGVYDQLSPSNWAEEQTEPDMVSGAVFQFFLEAPESQPVTTLTLEAFQDGEDFYDFYADGFAKYDAVLVEAILGPDMANAVETEINAALEVLSLRTLKVGIREAIEVSNVIYRLTRGNAPEAPFIRMNVGMDIRLTPKGGGLIGLLGSLMQNEGVLAMRLHFQVDYDWIAAQEAVCCAGRNLLEIEGENADVFFDSEEGEFRLENMPERPMSYYVNFPDIHSFIHGTAGDGRGEAVGVNDDVTVEYLFLSGDFMSGDFCLELTADMGTMLTVKLGQLEMKVKEIGIFASCQQQMSGFGLDGLAEFKLTEEEKNSLRLSAEKCENREEAALWEGEDQFALHVGAVWEDETWHFYAELAYGTISLPGVISRIAGITPPSGFDLRVTKFSVRFESGAGYEAACELDGTVPVLGAELVVGAQLTRLAQLSPETFLYGSISICGFLFTAKIQIEENASRLFFELSFDGALIRATAEEEIILVRIEKISIGALIRAFYRVIRPNVDYRLPEPWSLLNRVGISKLTIAFDRKAEKITVTKELDINLLVARVTGVGFTYWLKSPLSTAAEDGMDRFEVFLETDGDGPVSGGWPVRQDDNLYGRRAQTVKTPAPGGFLWDMLHENAPALFLGGDKFSVHYFALGRNVDMGAVSKDGKLRDILALLRENLEKNGARFDGETGWIVGADVTVAGCLSLCLLIYEPWLYGAQITMESDAVPGLKGLDLTLYYRKVTDSIGMFYLFARLPDAIRRVDLGAFSFTLPTIELEIYTNGNFKVNLGFPINRDFTQSFSFSYGIFSGSGGLYFGALNGDTSRTVPRILNGFFTPVIEIGVGIKLGICKGFDLGVLSLYAKLELCGIFEGTFATFRPADLSQPEALYYKCSALVCVEAELTGSVDFFLIKAGFHLYVRLQVMAVLEACEPSVVSFEAEISVSAYLKILFITIRFHFSFTYKDSFVLGEYSRTPWIVERERRLPAGIYVDRAMELYRNREAKGFSGDFGEEELAWDVAAPFETPCSLRCLVSPYFTGSAVRLSVGQAVENGEDYRTAFLTTLDAASFQNFVTGLAHRAFYAASGGAETITARQLYLLKEKISGESERNAAFMAEKLQKFFTEGFCMNLCVPDVACWEGQMEECAAIPFPPQLNLTWYTKREEKLVPGKTTVLMEYHMFTAEQIAGIRDYFGHFSDTSISDAVCRKNEEKQSACDLVFGDYCFMLTRQCVFDTVHRLEEDAGRMTWQEAEDGFLGMEYDIAQLAEVLPVVQYRGMGNRFLLGGVRLPVIFSDGDRFTADGQTPLYEIMGIMEQSLAPEGDGILHQLVVEKNPNWDCSWISFGTAGFHKTSVGSAKGDTLELLPQKKDANEGEKLTLSILAIDMEYPEPVLPLSFLREPAQLPAAKSERTPLSLKNGRRLYQRTDGAVSEKMIWELPISMACMRTQELTVSFIGEEELFCKKEEDTYPFSPALCMPIELHRESGNDTCASIIRIAQAQLELLEQAADISWTQALVLLPSPPQDNHGADPVYDAKQSEGISLLRSNMSRLTTPVPGKMTDIKEEKVTASITDLPAFLRLLGRMGQTGGGGLYWLFDVNAPDDSYFDDDGNCRAELLLMAETSVRESCLNVLVITCPETEKRMPVLGGAGVPEQVIPVLAQGMAGFSFALCDPALQEELTEAQVRTRQAFSLLNFRKPADPVFGGDFCAPPVSMQDGEPGSWEYRANFNVCHFMDDVAFRETADGDTNICGLSADLPIPPENENPYRGVLPAAGQTEAQKLPLSLFFTDVCGNAAFYPNGSGYPLFLDILYTDELIPLSAWLDTAFWYEIRKTDQRREGRECFRLALHGEFCGAPAKETRLPDAKRCALLYYQLHQPDMEIEISCTLADPAKVSALPKLAEALRRYSLQLYQYALSPESAAIPEPILFETDLPVAVPEGFIQEVETAVTVSRSRDRVMHKPSLPMGCLAETVLSPAADMDDFVEKMEAALQMEGFCVKLARGEKALFAVFLGACACPLEVVAKEFPAGLFALVPISSVLLNREDIRVVHLDGSQEKRSFYGIDPEPYARVFLEDVENVLSAGFVDELAGAGYRERLGELSLIKRRLSEAIPERVQGLFCEENPALLGSVRHALTEELASDLVKGFRIGGMMAYSGKAGDMEFMIDIDSTDVKAGRLTSENDVVVFAAPENLQATGRISLGNLDWRITHVALGEGTRRPVKAVAGKKDSREATGSCGWLTFLRPFRSLEGYGQVLLDRDRNGNEITVPVVLREYPAAVTLSGHHGGILPPEGMAGGIFWYYEASMKLKLTAQDRVSFDMPVNGGERQYRQESGEDLCSRLASWNVVHSELISGLHDAALRETAIARFCTLAKELADVWNVRQTADNAAQPGFVLCAVFDRGCVTEYRMTADSAQKKEAERGEIPWPVLTVSDAAGNQAAIRPVISLPTGGTGSAGETEAVYSLKEFPKVCVQAGEEAALSFLFENLPLERIQSLTMGVSTTRNEGFLLPGYGFKKMAEQFVYRLLRVTYPQEITPSLHVLDPVEAGSWSVEHFCSFFENLLSGCWLQLTVYLEQILFAGTGIPLTADFPIRLSLKAAPERAELEELAKEVDDWLTASGCRRAENRIRVCAKYDSSLLMEDRGVLEMNRILFSISD